MGAGLSGFFINPPIAQYYMQGLNTTPVHIGLTLMVLLSLLPIGFLQTGFRDKLRWVRVVGDTIFAVGIVALGWFVVGLKTGWSVQTD